MHHSNISFLAFLLNVVLLDYRITELLVTSQLQTEEYKPNQKKCRANAKQKPREVISMWEYIQPLRAEHSPASETFFKIPKGKAVLSKRHIPKLTWKLCVRVLSPRSTSFALKISCSLRKSFAFPNRFTPSFSVQRERTIPSCCQNSFMLGMMVSPSHSPVGLRFSKGTDTKWLQFVWLEGLM